VKVHSANSYSSPGKVGDGFDWSTSPQVLAGTLTSGSRHLSLRQHPSRPLPAPPRSTTIANNSGGLPIPAKSPPHQRLRQHRKHRLPSPVALPSPATSWRGGGDFRLRYLYGTHRISNWPSRDPIGERGGINLYCMVGNDAINGGDILGLISVVRSQDFAANENTDKRWGYRYYIRYFGDGLKDQFKIMLVKLSFVFEWCNLNCDTFKSTLKYDEWFLLNSDEVGMEGNNTNQHMDRQNFPYSDACTGTVTVNAEYGVAERGTTTNFFGLANQSSWSQVDSKKNEGEDVIPEQIAANWGTLVPGRFTITNNITFSGATKKWSHTNTFRKGDGCCKTKRGMVDKTTWTGFTKAVEFKKDPLK
jgi:hypothetical protein